MATSSDQSYDGDKQKQAAPNVQESQEAVDSSAKSSYALGSAQKPDVWGTERGPESFGHRSGDMFGEISDLLSKENALISEFETKMRQAMASIEETEADNEQTFRAVNQALEGVARSSQASALASSLQKAGMMSKQSGAGGADAGSSSAGGGSAYSGGETEGTQKAPDQGQQQGV